MLPVVAALVLSQYVRSHVSRDDPTSQCLWWVEGSVVLFEQSALGNPETPGDTEFTAVSASFATWNRQLERSGTVFRLALPSSRFNRTIGVWSGVSCDLAGNLVVAEEFARRKDQWLPSADDREFVRSLMQRVVDPARMAGWIAPPERGINSLPIDYEYVRLS